MKQPQKSTSRTKAIKAKASLRKRAALPQKKNQFFSLKQSWITMHIAILYLHWLGHRLIPSSAVCYGLVWRRFKWNFNNEASPKIQKCNYHYPTLKYKMRDSLPISTTVYYLCIHWTWGRGNHTCIHQWIDISFFKVTKLIPQPQNHIPWLWSTLSVYKYSLYELLCLQGYQAGMLVF